MTVAILDRSVHALDLTVGPEMFGLGEAMFDIVTAQAATKASAQKSSFRSIFSLMLAAVQLSSAGSVK
ncbi:hypothetical protein XH80_09825 [Bradyrhizobium sp. CCBAU 45384]|nr:hypothetical protein [Bradyrhizobium sp. CCBAU 45384]